MQTILFVSKKVKIFLVIGFMLLLAACQIPNKSKPIATKPSAAESNSALAAKPYSYAYKLRGKNYNVLASSEGFQQRGYASWYSHRFENRRTTTGERYHARKLTAAHRNLPLPSYVKVKNLENGREIVVKVNDRGPFKGGDERIIDLSYSAAKKLGIVGAGKGYVEIETLNVSSNDELKELQQQIDPPAKTTYVLRSERFTSRQKAKQFHQQVKSVLADNAEIKRVKTKRTTRYVVSVGPYPSKKEAQKSQTKLANIGINVKREEMVS